MFKSITHCGRSVSEESIPEGIPHLARKDEDPLTTQPSRDVASSWADRRASGADMSQNPNPDIQAMLAAAAQPPGDEYEEIREQVRGNWS